MPGLHSTVAANDRTVVQRSALSVNPARMRGAVHPS